MSPNPEKCVFGVTKGKFLGFQISAHRLEVNPDKVKVVLDMDPPRTLMKCKGRVITSAGSVRDWPKETSHFLRS
ncbi:LOW QUALITY PROTEIN: hypothetical protein V2J09_011435 [Rumex salicifolius]